MSVTLLGPLADGDRRADAWNDLGVSLFERAKAQGEPEDIAQALAAIDRAIEASPSSPEPRFNRALLLETLELRASASQAWREYLSLDAASPWAAEAKEHLASIAAPTRRERWGEVCAQLQASPSPELIAQSVRAFPREARAWTETEFLLRWAEAPDARSAAAALDLARAIGQELARQRGEELVRDAVAVIDRATAAADRDVLRDLARAQSAYVASRKLIGPRNPSAALLTMLQAETLFARRSSPISLLARYYRAGILVDARRTDEAMVLLDSVDASAADGYRALHAQVLWERERIAGRAGWYHDALRLARKAETAFDEIGDRNAATAMRIEIATLLNRLNQPSEAWRIWPRIFADASESGSADVMAAALDAAARDEIENGRFDVARSFFGLALAGAGMTPTLRFDALLWRAFAEYRMRLGHSVVRELPMIEAAARAISDPALRAEAQDQHRFVEALLAGSEEPVRAVRLFDETIAFREAAGRGAGLAEPYVERARLLQATGNVDAAAEGFERGLAVVERQRRALDQNALRDTFFDAARNACDGLIGIAVARRQIERVFDLAARCRGRLMLDVAAGSVAMEPMTMKEASARLLPENLLVHLLALPDRLVVLALTSSGARMTTIRGSFTDQPRLPQAVIASFAAELNGRKRLVIVPDERLESMPFATLIDPRSGQPLLRACEIEIAPSAAAFLSDSPPSAVSSHARMLAVGDPAFDRQSYPRLNRLPAAAREASQVGALYGDATTLTGSDASLSRVMNAAQQSDFIHIAAHGFVGARNAFDSALVLAPDASDGGMLTLRRLLTFRFARNPVVVLAGCDTGTSGGGAGSVRSLAYGFLAAGSRAVIATTQTVGDDDARAFSLALHRRLRAGLAPAAALREAQLEALDRDGRGSGWENFEVYVMRQ